MSYYFDYNNNWGKNHFSKRDTSLIYKYLKVSKNALDENEIYDIIKKNNYNEEKILKDIKQKAKIIEEKGDDYGWKEVKKGKIVKEEIKYNNKSKNKNRIYKGKSYNKNYINEENTEKKNNKNEHRNYRNYNSNDFYHYVSKQPKRPFQECIEVPSDYNPNLIKKNNIENTPDKIIEENKNEETERRFEENKIEETPGKEFEEIKETEYKTPSPENKINVNNIDNNIKENTEDKKNNEDNIVIVEKEEKNENINENNNEIKEDENKKKNQEIIQSENNYEKEEKKINKKENIIEEKKENNKENINEIIKEESINEEEKENMKDSKNNTQIEQLTLSEDSIKLENNNLEKEEIDEEREWRETNLRVYLDKLKNYSMTVEKTKKNNLSNKVFGQENLIENNRYEKNNLTIQSNNLNIQSSNNIFIPSKYNTPFRENLLKLINERKKCRKIIINQIMKFYFQ